MSFEPIYRFTANKKTSEGTGIKRTRKSSTGTTASVYGQRIRSVRDLHFTSEVLADIGVCPMENDDDDEDEDSSDVENDAPFRHSGKANVSALDMTVCWATEPLAPTPQENMIANSEMPLRVRKTSTNLIQSQNTSTSAAQENSNFKLKKRPRLDSPVSNKMDMFHEFSDEIFLQIFQWLPKSELKQCALVSRRWRRLSYDESLWRFLNLAGKKLELATLEHILYRGVIVMRLAKAEINAPVKPHILNNERFFKVQYLDLSMVIISMPALEMLISRCKSLLKLSLESCELNSKICDYIGNNKNLLELNLALSTGVDKCGLQTILSGCKKLMQLNLAWTSLEKDCVTYAVCDFPQSLKSLNLSGCRQTIVDTDVRNLTITCPDLEVLDLSDAIQLTSHSLNMIKNSFTHMRTLHLSRCYNIHPDSYKSLTEMPNLNELNVFGIIGPTGVEILKGSLGKIAFNVSPLSTIARPTTGIRRTSIWTLRVRD